ncbi:MAG: YbhB/YbcL family Raf kinase inhibitor-like protein [Bacteriovorax sp.]|nr:YbhB/YbcL family Raf kinase inhibitor-like protein [Bacteriovorax sp.]
MVKAHSQNEHFTAWSGSLKSGETVPNNYVFSGHGCDGKNISPPLEWDGAPSGTKSFAVTVFDPDAPTDHGWWHWAVLNIPANIHKIEEGASNEGRLPLNAIEVVTDFGDAHYGGPCPPKGDKPHRYVFTVYALKKEKLDVNKKLKAESIKKNIEENSIAKASFTVKYGR